MVKELEEMEKEEKKAKAEVLEEKVFPSFFLCFTFLIPFLYISHSPSQAVTGMLPEVVGQLAEVEADPSTVTRKRSTSKTRRSWPSVSRANSSKLA